MTISDLAVLAALLDLPVHVVLLVGAVVFIGRRVDRAVGRLQAERRQWDEEIRRGAQAIEAYSTFLRWLDRHAIDLRSVAGYVDARGTLQDTLDRLREAAARIHAPGR